MSDVTRTADMQREKKAVALSSIFAAVGITAMKVVVGITTGSLGILSEAAHSGLDLVAAAVTYSRSAFPTNRLTPITSTVTEKLRASRRSSRLACCC